MLRDFMQYVDDDDARLVSVRLHVLHYDIANAQMWHVGESVHQ